MCCWGTFRYPRLCGGLATSHDHARDLLLSCVSVCAPFRRLTMYVGDAPSGFVVFETKYLPRARGEFEFCYVPCSSRFDSSNNRVSGDHGAKWLCRLPHVKLIISSNTTKRALASWRPDDGLLGSFFHCRCLGAATGSQWTF